MANTLVKPEPNEIGVEIPWGDPSKLGAKRMCVDKRGYLWFGLGNGKSVQIWPGTPVPSPATNGQAGATGIPGTTGATGAPGASATWPTNQTITGFLSGAITLNQEIGTPIVPPLTGTQYTTLTAISLNCDTGPTGAALIFALYANGVATGTSISVAAGATTGSVSSLAVALPTGGYLMLKATQVGSTVAGSNVYVTLTMQ